MSKLTDYGIVLLVQLATFQQQEGGTDPRASHNARELAEETRLPLPVVSKLLKILAREGILVSHRGAKGGYSLARAPEGLSIAEVIRALEGPIALTECGVHPGQCAQETSCSVRAPWQRINEIVVRALRDVTVAELVPGATPGGGGAAAGRTAAISIGGRA